MTKGVLFDLDGVVVDSESIYTQFWSDIDKLYPTGVENFAIAIKGNTLQRILADYFPDNDVKQDILERIKDFEINMRYKPFAEAIRFINELKRNQFRIAIVTSSSQKKMDNLYAQNPGFREMFDAVVTGDMVSHSKPDPEPYLLGAKAIGVAPESCYVFEDSISGIESGIRAGATVIGLATTLPYDKIDGKAHLTINDFTGFHVGDMLSVEK
ncbi:MAG: HAD family hydrolase [Candidatus Limisoma sp.]|nr:HAD family hydrolase [Bacteroidales bacterium]MDY5894723.1 HAD family hydrolase [Candidatus Limisoma sp.]